MTRRKQARDKNGKFLPHGQTPREKPRPDTRASGGNAKPRPDDRCEECGEELTYAWMHSGRASYHIGRCMRCTPEPPVIVRE